MLIYDGDFVLLYTPVIVFALIAVLYRLVLYFEMEELIDPLRIQWIVDAAVVFDSRQYLLPQTCGKLNCSALYCTVLCSNIYMAVPYRMYGVLTYTAMCRLQSQNIEYDMIYNTIYSFFNTLHENKISFSSIINHFFLLFQFTAKDQARTSVSVTVCQQPSPRSNFSMTALPNGEISLTLITLLLSLSSLFIPFNLLSLFFYFDMVF